MIRTWVSLPGKKIEKNEVGKLVYISNAYQKKEAH